MGELQTARTILRRPNDSDFHVMRKFESNPLIMRFTPSRVPHAEEETKERLAKQLVRQESLVPFGIWIAEEKSSGEAIGWFMLMPSEVQCLELGFMVIEEAWGKGFAPEVAQRLIEYAGTFSNIEAIHAKTTVDNHASMKVLSKLGFKFEKIIEVDDAVTGTKVPLNFYSLSAILR